MKAESLDLNTIDLVVRAGITTAVISFITRETSRAMALFHAVLRALPRLLTKFVGYPDRVASIGLHRNAIVIRSRCPSRKKIPIQLGGGVAEVDLAHWRRYRIMVIHSSGPGG